MAVQLYEYGKVYKDQLRPPAPGVLQNFKVFCTAIVCFVQGASSLISGQQDKHTLYPCALRVRVCAALRPDQTRVMRRPEHVLEQEVIWAEYISHCASLSSVLYFVDW